MSSISHPVCASTIGRQSRQSWSDSEWQWVIFIDESRFFLGGDDQRICVWRDHGQRQDERSVVRGQASRRPCVTSCQPLPQHLQELCESIQAPWDGLSQDTFRNLYGISRNSMLRRLACCVSKHGSPKPYQRHYFCMCSSMNIDHISLDLSSFSVPGNLYLPYQQQCNPTLPSGCNYSFDNKFN